MPWARRESENEVKVKVIKPSGESEVLTYPSSKKLKEIIPEILQDYGIATAVVTDASGTEYEEQDGELTLSETGELTIAPEAKGQ